MVRRRTASEDVNGWIVIDKPAGIASSAVVNKARVALEARKAGHAGTLDPAATGLLAVALGEATKTVSFVTDARKAYRFTVRWGQATNTDDAEGEVIETSQARPTEERILAALPGFIGEIMQVPPIFSAVKVKGERAYKRARRGEDVELEARPLTVDKLTLVEMPDADHAVFNMVCGKGGYVRSLARDLGRELGCLGHAIGIRRTWLGPFEAKHALSYEMLDKLARSLELDHHLLPLEVALAGLPELICSPEAAGRIQAGNPGDVGRAEIEPGADAWGSLDGRAVAVGTYRDGQLHPHRVFRT